ncbi:hypothetical protein L596_016156 [Steinernema carpocapsae]|uniref:Piwi domain-containing protein n=2 Tax=Steinernema carpocapsae TaxID=34508 RepID=A0A4U5NH62_STECR|nr:hypothetical protein L596_016156 [Steinernema carpocapsae]
MRGLNSMIPLKNNGLCQSKMSAGPSNLQPDVELRPATKIRHAAEIKFKEMGIEVGIPEMPPKIPVPPNGNVKLTSNLYAVRTSSQIPIYRYDLDITISQRNGKQLALTKKSDSDAVSIDRKLKTKIIFFKMVQTYPELFSGVHHCIYDLESTLFTLNDIMKDDPEAEPKTLVIEGLDGAKFQGTTSATVILKKCHDRFEVDLTNFSHLELNIESTDLSHKQFLELVTSQIPMMSDSFVTFPGGVSFSMNASTTELPEGKYLGHGVQKSVRYVENPQTRKPMAAIALDLKKTAFHAVLTGLDYLSQIVDDRPLHNGQKLPNSVFGSFGALKKMKGLRCCLQYGNRYREVVIHEISNKTAQEHYFDREGQQITVENYFYQMYNLRLKCPTAPLAGEKKPGQKALCYYPLELIRVLDNQRVTGELPQKVIRDVIKHAAVVPALRIRQIQDSCADLGLFGNDYLQNVDTVIDSRPIGVEGRQLKNPKMVFGKNTSVESRNGQWPNRGAMRPPFFIPSTIRKWSVLMISNLQNGFASETMHTFVSSFINECRARGMTLPAPSDPWALNAREELKPQMEGFFSECPGLGIEFVLVLQDDCFHEHKFLKFIERKYNVISQDVNMKTVQKCLQRAAATLENIVQKTNIKLGGLNYSIEMTNPAGTSNVFQPDTMYVGLAMSHSKPPKPDSTGREPPKPASVVGFAANVLPQNFAFVGDYYFQAADRDEKIDSIVPIMHRILDMWCQHHEGQMPKNILFFRNGASEGQYKSILKFEVPLIKHALEKFRNNCGVEQMTPETKFSLVVATKRHNVRIFKANIQAGRPNEQNLPPGIAVDRSIVHPMFAEFFVNSHTTLQGTGKTPRYTIMHNGADFKIGQLEHIVFGLAHGHQIVNLCTSLPTPSYIAGDYADRGMVVLHEFLKTTRAEADQYDTFNEQLTYAALQPESRFHYCRVNA